MIEHAPDGTLHMTREHVDTLLLALCCLEALWKAHPDVVRKMAPDLVDHAPRAAQLLEALRKAR